MLQQYSQRPFEIFTVDGLFSDSEIDAFRDSVIMDPCVRKFTFSEFRNGKIIDEAWSRLAYERIAPFLPDVYEDAAGRRWTFTGACKYKMFATVEKGQQFAVHTDTGAVYDKVRNLYSKHTLLTYLNDDFDGGNTLFFDDDFKVTSTIVPKRNRTLVFDIDLFHSGSQVLSGTKHWCGTELVSYKN